LKVAEPWGGAQNLPIFLQSMCFSREATLLGVTHKTFKPSEKDLLAVEKFTGGNTREEGHIFDINRSMGTSLPEINEANLKGWLIENDYFFSHLKDKPQFYCASKFINKVEYSFITQYFDDGESWVGMSYSLDEAKEMILKAARDGVELIVLGADKNTLTTTLVHPELCGFVCEHKSPVPPKEPAKFVTKKQLCVDALKNTIKSNDIVFVTGQPWVGKSELLSAVITSDLTIDKSKGKDARLTEPDFGIPAKAYDGVFAIDEAQTVKEDDLLRLVASSFKNLATLVIVTQDISMIPASSINMIAKKSNGRLINLLIGNNGIPCEKNVFSEKVKNLT
jgi:hypothetical protein